jgi:hypothetical protein
MNGYTSCIHIKVLIIVLAIAIVWFFKNGQSIWLY